MAPDALHQAEVRAAAEAAEHARSESRLLSQILGAAVGADGAIQEAAAHLHALRATGVERSQRLDQLMLQEISRMRTGLQKAEEVRAQLGEMLERLTSPPLFPAIYLGAVPTDSGEGALVQIGSSRSIVVVSEDVDSSELVIGADVLLSAERNALVGCCAQPIHECGETAYFDRYTHDRRLVLRVRDEELVARASALLQDVELRNGDAVRWDRSAWMAFELLERPRGEHLFLETPKEGFEAVGGLEMQIATLRDLLGLAMQHRNEATRYKVFANRGVLLSGPVGNGKTMLGRAIAHELGGRFMYVKPGSWADMWYGESERKCREQFRVAREAAEADPRPVVMFFDELDYFVRRGMTHNHVDDRLLNAFLVEVDGILRRGNVLLIGATNRPDVLDEALMRPERFGDKSLELPRPNQRAAREIFRTHLPLDVPYACDGRNSQPAETREALIEAAVSYLYAPNGCGDVLKLTLRDGRQQVVKARDLMSGARIAQIVRTALETACLRDIQTGARGVTVEDMLAAAADSIDGAARVLTPGNCRWHVSVPQDVDVVRVERVAGKVSRPHRYMKVA